MTHQTHRDRNQSRSRRLFAASVWWLVLLCGPASLYAQGKVPVLSPGTYDQTLPQKNGPPIHYAISVPPGYRGEPVPLVLALHFGGAPDGAGRAMLDILIQPALGALGAIIVAPDSIECPCCDGRLRLVALIEQARIVERILRHLGLPTDRPVPRPARAPPLHVDDLAFHIEAPTDATS